MILSPSLLVRRTKPMKMKRRRKVWLFLMKNSHMSFIFKPCPCAKVHLIKTSKKKWKFKMFLFLHFRLWDAVKIEKKNMRENSATKGRKKIIENVLFLICFFSFFFFSFTSFPCDCENVKEWAFYFPGYRSNRSENFECDVCTMQF